MHKRKVIQMTVLIMILALVFQAGVFAYTKVAAVQNNHDESALDSKYEEIDLKKLQSKITKVTFEQFLKEFKVQEVYQQKIEKLISEGYNVADICIAYDFLYHNYGSVSEWEELLASKASGESWDKIFIKYNKKHPEFEPRNFDSEELERLMNIQNVTPDDIMISDRLSFVSGKPFNDLINEKNTTGDWGSIFSRENILNSGSPFPRVRITSEEIHKYMQGGKLKEQQITRAFVLAQRVGEAPEIVIGKIQHGFSEELILAESYISKYGE
ncbi:hypothetical protein [Paenibacillus agri]|uniref:Uncharacterized protein n=1 Tax=Paenibacillus agri TaxID=2744309 RepID=A0A850EE92_9BACL|nr:hypothetical protein [Paenibacillus agri]NUU59593.1 hypothetical protein [Paenibacillus agri]